MLQARRSADRFSVEARFSVPVKTGSGSHPAYCTMSTGSFLRVKRLESAVNYPHTQSGVEVKERIELCLYSLSVPSWQVTGWTVCLTIVSLNLTVFQTLKQKWKETPICTTRPIFPNLQIFMILEFTFCKHEFVVSYNFCLISHVFLAVRFIPQQKAWKYTEFSVYVSISSISCFQWASILLFCSLHGQWPSIHTQRLRIFDTEMTVSSILSNYTQQSSSWESIAALLTKIYLTFYGTPKCVTILGRPASGT